MVDYIGVNTIQKLINAIGPGEFIERLAAQIEADYRRWPEFEKSARLASHSPVGVIELMPTCDGQLYSFKYVNGHPKNTAAGLLTVTAFGVLAEVDTGYPAAALRADRHDGAAHRRNVGARRAMARTSREPRDGADRQWRAERVPGHRLPSHARHSRAARVRRRSARDRQARAQPARDALAADLRVVRATSAADACKGADIVTTVTADKRKAVILTPPMVAPGHAPERGGRRLPRQDRAARGRPAHAGRARRRRVRAAVAHRGRSAADADPNSRSPSSPTSCAARRRAAAPRRTSPCSTRSASRSRITRRCASCTRCCRSSARCAADIDLVPMLQDPKDLFGGTLGSGRARLRIAG